MRVIGGIYRRRTLRAVEGLDVRPTSDRLRETLFNILSNRVQESRFLDLCAGSGAVGIEALSRGARHLVLIEQSRRACAVIEANLRELSISCEATLICRDALVALKQLAAESEPFDLIFFDPPYASGLYGTVMDQLAKTTLLSDEGIVIVEYRAKTPPPDECGRLTKFRELKQGESALAFYQAV